MAKRTSPYRQTGIRPNGNIPAWAILLYVVGMTAAGAVLAYIGIAIAKSGF